MSAQKAVPVTGCWLRTQGDSIQVLLEIEGSWRLAIQERVADGARVIISHMAEPDGILSSPVDPLTQPSPKLPPAPNLDGSEDNWKPTDEPGLSPN